MPRHTQKAGQGCAAAGRGLKTEGYDLPELPESSWGSRQVGRTYTSRLRRSGRLRGEETVLGHRDTYPVAVGDVDVLRLQAHAAQDRVEVGQCELAVQRRQGRRGQEEVSHEDDGAHGFAHQGPLS